MLYNQRLGCQALHLSPGGDRCAPFAFIQTNTGPGNRKKPLYSDYWMAITKSSEAQTSGGLLATVRPDQSDALVNTLREHGDTETAVIGYVKQLDDPSVLLEIL
jgi:hypothetical protein